MTFTHFTPKYIVDETKAIECTTQSNTPKVSTQAEPVGCWLRLLIGQCRLRVGCTIACCVCGMLLMLQRGKTTALKCGRDFRNFLFGL